MKLKSKVVPTENIIIHMKSGQFISGIIEKTDKHGLYVIRDADVYTPAYKTSSSILYVSFKNIVIVQKGKIKIKDIWKEQL